MTALRWHAVSLLLAAVTLAACGGSDETEPARTGFDPVATDGKAADSEPFRVLDRTSYTTAIATHWPGVTRAVFCAWFTEADGAPTERCQVAYTGDATALEQLDGPTRERNRALSDCFARVRVDRELPDCWRHGWDEDDVLRGALVVERLVASAQVPTNWPEAHRVTACAVLEVAGLGRTERCAIWFDIERGIHPEARVRLRRIEDCYVLEVREGQPVPECWWESTAR